MNLKPGNSPSNGISFFVPGIPRPGGSKTAFFNKKLGRAMIVDACKGNADWRATVRQIGAQAMAGRDLLRAPLALRIDFCMPRPKAHYRKDGTLKPNAPAVHSTRPDATKLTRAVEDALTGVVWTDDALVWHQEICKFYRANTGAFVIIRPLQRPPTWAEHVAENREL